MMEYPKCIEPCLERMHGHEKKGWKEYKPVHPELHTNNESRIISPPNAEYHRVLSTSLLLPIFLLAIILLARFPGAARGAARRTRRSTDNVITSIAVCLRLLVMRLSRLEKCWVCALGCRMKGG